MSHGNTFTGPEVIVRLDGVPTPVESVRIRSEIPSDMALFSGGGGVVEAQADITWAASSGLSTSSEHPWLPSWDKQVGKAVTVDVIGLDGASTVRLFTGTIDSTRADMGQGVVTSTCYGHEINLNVEATIPSVAYKMPPATEGEPVCRPGMTSMWLTGHIAAQGGFFSHQPWQPTRVVAASMMGSLWPEKGILQAGYSTTRTPVGTLAPLPAATAWGGVACRDPYAKWRGTHTGSATDPWTLAHDLGDPTVGTNYTVRVVTPSSGEGFGLRVTQTDVFVQRYTVAAGAWADVPGLTLTRTPDSTRVQVQYIAGELELALDRGFQPAPVAVALAMDHTVAEVTVNGTGDVGAVQVYRSVTPVTHEPRTMRVRRDVTATTIGALQYKRDNALRLLFEQSDREEIPMWVDGEGVLQVADRDVLDSGPAKAVVADIPDLSRTLLELDANRFTNPVPDSTDGFTAGPSTGIGVASGQTLPYLVVVNTGSSASTLGRYAEVEVPVTPGAVETWNVMARSPSGARATIHVEFISPGGGFIDGASVTGSATTATNEWEPISVTAEVPIRATGARIRVGNAGTLPAFAELHFRGFSTLGPGVPLEGLIARTSTRAQYGRVVVKAREGRVSVRNVPTFLLWSWSKQTLSVGDGIEEFATPQDGRTWLHVDTDFGYAGEAGSSDYPRGVGSWVGGHTVRTDNGNANAWVDETHWPITMEQIDPDTVLITGTVVSLPANMEVVNLAYELSTSVPQRRKDDPLPELRGMGYVTWTDVETIKSLGGNGPDYIIDMDWYGQSPTRRLQLANEAQARLLNPPPVLDPVAVPLSAIFPGDRVQIVTREVAGLTIDAVVLGVDIDVGAGSMNLSVRVLSAEVTSLTLPQIPDVDDFLSA